MASINRRQEFRPAFFVWAPEEKMAELRSGCASPVSTRPRWNSTACGWASGKKRGEIVPDCYLSLMSTAKMDRPLGPVSRLQAVQRRFPHGPPLLSGPRYLPDGAAEYGRALINGTGLPARLPYAGPEGDAAGHRCERQEPYTHLRRPALLALLGADSVDGGEEQYVLVVRR